MQDSPIVEEVCSGFLNHKKLRPSVTFARLQEVVCPRVSSSALALTAVGS